MATRTAQLAERARDSDVHRRDPAPRSPTMLSGWGGLALPGRERLGEDLELATRGAVLSRGLGRSYGDSSLPAVADDIVAGTRFANRILAFDEARGVLRAEAGLSLAELNPIVMARGFFPPVTPGTQYVTLGGMVASDVHGKNHHRAGCFGAHVRALRMRLADDSIVECGPDHEPDLFCATVGGMGLTGHILEVEFALERIPSPWLVMETLRVHDIDAYLAALAEAAPRSPMTVGWIDCLHRGSGLGRGLLTSGRWATAEEVAHLPPMPTPPPKVTLPFALPNWGLNPLTARAFNGLYYWRQLGSLVTQLVGPEPFFYPLDAILHWNRGYGARGFHQYQCVLPRRAGPEAVREFMERLTRTGAASPLCVIKDCGPEGRGLLSFPLAGTSIAVDMPVTGDSQRVVDALNEFVIAAGGRIYLTKDRFTRAAHFAAMEPRLPAFLAARERFDPKRRLRSAQSVRLFGDRP